MSTKKKSRSSKLAKPQTNALTGWKAIAEFLKIPASTVHRWAKAGMPVRREGRLTIANRDELLSWLGREAGMPRPAHIATNSADLAAGLKESITVAKKRKSGSEVRGQELAIGHRQ